MSLRSTLAHSTRLRRARPLHVVFRNVSRKPTPDHQTWSTLKSESPLLSSLGPPPSAGGSSSSQPKGKNLKPEGSEELSDKEWDMRTGEAIFLLQQTLPTFFSTGLVSSMEDFERDEPSKHEEGKSIYSPDIRLEYTPPTAFPSPFPRTLHVEGLPLYVGSSVFIRHTMNALYTDLRVELMRVRVYDPYSSSGLAADSNGSDIPDVFQRSRQGKTRRIREKSFFIALMVHGVNRVTKAEGGWQVNSTYTFSPTTGLIYLHRINSIHPAPHQALFSALLEKIGLGRPGAGESGIARPLPSSKPQPLPSVAIPDCS